MSNPAPIPLFRVEVLERLKERSFGAVVLARPLSYTFLTMLFVGIAAAIVCFFVAFSYTRKSQVAGVLLPSKGLIRVVPPQAGVVLERRVQEGQSVAAGDIMFVLSSERDSPTQINAEATVSSLLRSRRDSYQGEQAQLQQQSMQRMGAVSRRMEALEDEVAPGERSA